MLFPSKERLKAELLASSLEFSNRGLRQSSVWCAEQAHAIEAPVDPSALNDFYSDMPPTEVSRYVLAKSVFDLKEYSRAAFFLESCSSPKSDFLRFYAYFLAGENRKLEDMTEPVGPVLFNSDHFDHLRNLQCELKHRATSSGGMDGYLWYLYGVVLKKQSLTSEAKQAFCQSVSANPMLYASWWELTHIIQSKDELEKLPLPSHWMKEVLTLGVYLQCQLNVEAVDAVSAIFNAGLEKSPFFLAQLAKAHHSLRDVDASIECFSEVQKLDPYRLEDLDTYSNDFYVKGMRVELSHLAHQMVEVSKYRHETCCVIGNYYSLRQEHEKAVLYFQRALKLNPNYLSAWTLMGHELLELKNSNGAIHAYRRAIQIDPGDFRAWYGLGQTYEIVKMFHYATYYFSRAHILRPYDSRFLVALGSCYENLDKLHEARKCYWRAHSVGDTEGCALLKLGRLFERMEKEEEAANVYLRYIEDTEVRGCLDSQEQGTVYLFLAKYYLKSRSGSANLEEVYDLALKAAQYRNTKEAGKAILREVVEKRKELSSPMSAVTSDTSLLG